MIPLFSEKDHIYLTWMLEWRRNWWTTIIARSTCAKSFVMVVINDAGWLGLHGEESDNVHNCPR